MRKIIKILSVFVILIIISLMFLYKIKENRLITKICGFGILRVTSGSMENELLIGDIIIIKECEEYKVNDIITYNVQNKYLVTHRILEKSENNYVTKGDNNNNIDIEKIAKEDIEGKYVYKSKLLKWIYEYRIFVCIIIAVTLILW